MTFLRMSISVDHTIAYDIGRAWFAKVMAKVPALTDVWDDPALELELESFNRFLNVVFGGVSHKDVFAEPVSTRWLKLSVSIEFTL